MPTRYSPNRSPEAPGKIPEPLTNRRPRATGQNILHDTEGNSPNRSNFQEPTVLLDGFFNEKIIYKKAMSGRMGGLAGGWTGVRKG